MIIKFSQYILCCLKQALMMDETKWVYILIEDDDFLEKYNTVRDKATADIKKEFDSEPAYNKTFLKTKIKSRCDEVTGF